MDELIGRLRERAADPARRTEIRPTEFSQGIRALDLAGLVASLGRARSDLDRAVAASRTGRLDAKTGARADELEAEMTREVPSDLPAVVGPDALEQAEATLGFALPPFVRRLYLEIADGGFGPGTGLLSLDGVVARHAQLRAGDELPRGRSWPEGLVPLVDRDPGCDCVEAGTGRVVNWDPDGLSERSGEAVFRRSFRDVAPTVEVWLGRWLDAKTFEERMAEQVATANVRAAREARARIAAKTPEERAQMGLPAVGWERVVWGGLGLDEDEA